MIDIFATEEQALFKPGTMDPTDLLKLIVEVIADIAKTFTNGIAIEGHVPSGPIVLVENLVWDSSTDAANSVRKLFEKTALDEARILRVTGHANREPALSNTMSIRNNRIEVILLRETEK